MVPTNPDSAYPWREVYVSRSWHFRCVGGATGISALEQWHRGVATHPSLVPGLLGLFALGGLPLGGLVEVGLVGSNKESE